MQTFRKAERLSSKVVIEQLFTTGKTFYSKPFKIYWLLVPPSDKTAVKVLISVPKRNFKRAVDRNRLKRLIREAYRKNKTILVRPAGGEQLLLMFLYIEKTIEEYATIEAKMIETLKAANTRVSVAGKPIE
jgi:ribonuclease P protein component